ncbi:MAG: DUF4278 domain-containing protein [Spirulina sp. SIO3F2]|nr:DUF4278 domain-containing protein [Spirulina sp. SIO3F2]
MKLSYRGQTYTTANAPVQGETVNVAGTYRGVKTIFAHQQAEVSHNRQLTYRGAHYAG